MPQDLINKANSIDPEVNQRIFHSTRQAYRLYSATHTDCPPRSSPVGGSALPSGKAAAPFVLTGASSAPGKQRPIPLLARRRAPSLLPRPPIPLSLLPLFLVEGRARARCVGRDRDGDVAPGAAHWCAASFVDCSMTAFSWADGGEAARSAGAPVSIGAAPDSSEGERRDGGDPPPLWRALHRAHRCGSMCAAWWPARLCGARSTMPT